MDTNNSTDDFQINDVAMVRRNNAGVPPGIHGTINNLLTSNNEKDEKYIIASVLALSTIFAAQAQGVNLPSYPTVLEINQAKATWFNSNNAAGMILTPLSDFRYTLSRHDMKVGDYRLQQEGDLKTLDIHISGSSPLGKARVWGEFSYQM